VAFYTQNPQYLVPAGGEPRLSNRMRERLALAIMGLVAAAYQAARPPLTAQQLSRRLRMPMHGVAAVLDALQEGGVLACSQEPPGYLPARELDAVSVHEVLALVRSAGEDRYLNPSVLEVSPAMQEVLDRVDSQSEKILGAVSVSSLAAPEVK
jgi:membrane protein